MAGVCLIEDCAKPHDSLGYCGMHAQRIRRYDDPTRVRKTREPVPVGDRFWDKVDKSGECWIWTARCDPKGYGRINRRGESPMAHRVAYELEVGPIPEGLTLDHLCRNHACVNPAHLEPVTVAENVRRGVPYRRKAV